MISIVNKTTYANLGGLTSGSFSLSSPSTIGNLLVISSFVGFPNNRNPPVSFHTDQGESFSLVQGAIDGFSSAWIFRLLTTKIANSISFATVSGATSATPAAIVYEISGTSLTFAADGVSGFGIGVNTYQQTLSSAPTKNSIIFYVPISEVTVSGVSPSPTESDLLPTPPGGGVNDIVSCDIYSNLNSDPKPTFTLSSTSTIGCPAAAFSESGVSLIPTVTGIASNPNPSAEGINVVFSVGINGAGTPSPSGTVTFNIDGSNVAIVPAIADGIGQATAQWQTTTLAIGNHSVYAVYSGDTVYATSTSPTIAQVVVAFKQTSEQQMQQDFGNSTADVIWWHTGFTGIDDEILGWEGWINEGGTPNIPWLLGLSVSQGNAMTEAIARGNIAYLDNIDDGGGGGNESGAQMFGGAQSGGAIVDW